MDYTGPIIFSVDCPLQDLMGNSLVVPLKPLSFTVQESVPITANAYMSSQQCEAQHCDEVLPANLA